MAGLAGLMLTGCDGLDSAGLSGSDEPPLAAHSIDPETGEVRMIIPRKDGTATLRSGPSVPVSLPEGFTLLPGTKVTTHSLFSRPEGQGSLVTFEVDTEAGAVVAHFRGQAKAAGFAITLENNTAGTLLMVGERKRDGARLVVTATPGEPTTGQLMLSTIPAG